MGTQLHIHDLKLNLVAHVLSTYRVQFQTQVCGSTFKTRITIRLVDPEVYWWVSTSLISLWRCLKFTWSRPYNMKKTHWPRDFRNRIIEAATNKNHTSLDFIFLPKYFKVQKLKKTKNPKLLEVDIPVWLHMLLYVAGPEHCHNRAFCVNHEL